MQRAFLTLLPITLCFGCSGDRDRDPGTRVDASVSADSGASSPDSGVSDAGAADSGAPDAGETPDPPQVLLQLRELDVVVFGGDAVASAVIARPASVLPESGCVLHEDAQPPLPAFGAISASGISVDELVCFDDSSTGVAGQRCLSNGAAPPPIPGSTMDTGPWLQGSDVTLAVSGGAAIGALSGTLTPPAAAELLEPTTLPTAVDQDLTVRWTALGHTDVQVEVEVMVGQSAGLVLCAPDSDGQVVVPSNLLGDSILRVMVANVAQDILRDGQDRGLAIQVLRGRMVAE